MQIMICHCLTLKKIIMDNVTENLISVFSFIACLSWCFVSFKFYKKHNFELSLIAGVIAFLFLGITISSINI